MSEKVNEVMAKWKVEGDYFESCNCDTICKCVFLSDPDNGFCDVQGAWHIEKGEFDGTNLDGLNAVMYVHAPGNMMKQGNFEAALYTDSRANEKQTEALQKIFTGQAGGHMSHFAALITKILGSKQVPIEYKINGKIRSIHIPNVADVEIEPVKGMDPSKEAYISNAPMAVSPQFPNYVATSRRSTYTDYGRNLDNSGKNGFFARFAYSP